MITQTALVALAGAAAGLYLLARAWRTWAPRKGGGCGGGCGCAAKQEGPKLIAAEELLGRVRRGASGRDKEPGKSFPFAP